MACEPGTNVDPAPSQEPRSWDMQARRNGQTVAADVFLIVSGLRPSKSAKSAKSKIEFSICSPKKYVEHPRRQKNELGADRCRYPSLSDGTCSGWFYMQR